MKHLYFLRHGESVSNTNFEWSRKDSPLTKNGIIQSKQAGKKILDKELNIDLIISSPFERAYSTAKIVANCIAYPKSKIKTDLRVVEIGLGELEGTIDLNVSKIYRENESSLDKYRGTEKLVELQKRANDFYKYVQSLDEETILIVSHGAFYRALHRTINKIPISERGTPIKNAELVKLV